MKIVVLGAGAIGSLVGGLLSKENEVTLIGRKGHMGVITKDGLKIDGLNELIVKPTALSDFDIWEPSDLLILTVKSYDTDTAMAQVEPLMGSDTIVLSIQNGLGNTEKIANHVNRDRIIGGTTSHGATFIDNGHVRHTGTGDTVIGKAFAPNDERVEGIAEVLTKAGIDTGISDNINGEIWAKAIVNAAINPLTAILGKRNGFLVENEGLMTVMAQVVEESTRVAEATGIRLPGCDLLEKTYDVAKRTANNKSSMLQDIERGKRTEIEEINGEIVRLGMKNGLKVEMNRTLYLLVKALEEGNRNKY